MNFTTMEKQLLAARRSRNVLACLLAAAVMGNALLALRVMQENTQVVLVPSRISDGMVARGAVDVRYVEALALDAVNALYNLSPATVDYGRNVVERLAASGDRARLLTQFDTIGDDVRGRSISTVFRPERLERDMERLQVIIRGELTTYYNQSAVSTDARSFRLTFVAEGSSIRLSQIDLIQEQNQQ